MFKSIRKEGLQTEAVLNMGNCIYSVMLGTISAIIMYLFTTDQILPKIYDELPVRAPSYMMFLLLILYYMVDWHDMNRVAYFDRMIGMRQMCRWIVCVLLLGWLAILALFGSLSLIAFITALYTPLAMSFRDQDLNYPTHEGKNHQESFLMGINHAKKLYAFKQKRRRRIILAVVLVTVGISLAVLFHLYLSQNVNAMRGMSGLLLIIWSVMLVLKFQRSQSLIATEYRCVVTQMLQQQEHIYQLLVSFGKTPKGNNR